jgi:hypothetical protein
MKKLMVILAIAVALVVVTVPALAWKEGPGTNWYYVDASYGGYHNSVPLVIEINGNPAAGQTFNVGDTIAITGDLHAVAQSCGGGGNGAYTEWLLEVDGPSGPDSTGDWNYDHSSGCAVADVVTTLAITYDLTALGMHTAYMSSYAAVAQYWTDVDEDFVDASLTFEVVMPVVIIDGCDTGVTDQVVDGSTISEKIAECAVDARNHGEFVRCVAHLTNDLVPGYITGREKGAIQSCAAQADIP